MKQAKDILESNAGKDILGHYLENLKTFKNMTESEYRKKIKSEDFDKWMAYLLIANLYQSIYGGLGNGMASQYSMKNYQYPKYLISASEMIKNHWHNGFWNEKNRAQDIKTQNPNKQNNSG